LVAAENSRNTLRADNSSPINTLIRWRDHILDRFLGAPVVLNRIEVPDKTISPRAIDLLSRAIAADGRTVDYAALKDSDTLNAYHAQTGALRTFDLSSLTTRNMQLAFWINTYNALVIDAVLHFKEVTSVSHGMMGPLAFFHHTAYEIGGYVFTADDIEHGILRGNKPHAVYPFPTFAPADPRTAFVIRDPDPRIHFALNCATLSCPPIRYYDAERIEEQLDIAARGFIASEVLLDKDKATLYLSRIFKWYAVDFGGGSGVFRFVSRYMGEDGEWLLNYGARPVYTRYDWHLNKVQ
jgi:hypothetical protein